MVPAGAIGATCGSGGGQTGSANTPRGSPRNGECWDCRKRWVVHRNSGPEGERGAFSATTWQSGRLRSLHLKTPSCTCRGDCAAGSTTPFLQIDFNAAVARAYPVTRGRTKCNVSSRLARTFAGARFVAGTRLAHPTRREFVEVIRATGLHGAGH